MEFDLIRSGFSPAGIKAVDVLLAHLKNRRDYRIWPPLRPQEDGRMGAHLTGSQTESRPGGLLGGCFCIGDPVVTH